MSVNDGDTFTDANVPEDWKGAEKGGKGDSAGGEDVWHFHEGKVVHFESPRQPPHALSRPARTRADYDLMPEMDEALRKHEHVVLHAPGIRVEEV